MASGNYTRLTEFIFVGLECPPKFQVIFFILILIVYLINVTGNVGMIFLIWIDARLHTPMYFFLSHLAFADVSFSSTVAPKMLRDFFEEKKTISFLGCALQQWFVGIFMTTECLLLASMAYDRFVAICNPLLYSTIMSQRLCNQLVAIPYTAGFIVSITHVPAAFCLPFCDSNIINHFFCDFFPLLAVICADTTLNEILVIALGIIFGIISVLIILVSYIYILAAILRIKSAEGRQKAFSTCSSHLTVITILYGTLFFVYVQPNSNFFLDTNKLVSVFYTTVTPMLNPLIYSLRNKEVKDAIHRTIAKTKFCIKI